MLEKSFEWLSKVTKSENELRTMSIIEPTAKWHTQKYYTERNRKIGALKQREKIEKRLYGERSELEKYQRLCRELDVVNNFSYEGKD